MRGCGKSDFHSRSGLQNTNSTGSLPPLLVLEDRSMRDGSCASRYGPPIMPRERMTSRMTWMSSDQFRGSWKTKIAEIGMFEKSACCYGRHGDVRCHMTWRWKMLSHLRGGTFFGC